MNHQAVTVFHCAAIDNFIFSYQRVEETNVMGPWTFQSGVSLMVNESPLIVWINKFCTKTMPGEKSVP
jgi:hypothetical protein